MFKSIIYAEDCRFANYKLSLLSGKSQLLMQKIVDLLCNSPLCRCYKCALLLNFQFTTKVKTIL